MPDKTQEAVRRQVEAMGCDRFEIGVFDAISERMIPRIWDKETVLKSIAWLRYENLRGRNIYIRPAGEHNLTLVDDLKALAIQRMKKEGFAPALVVETSPANFQAWLDHGKTLEKSLSTAVAKALAKEYQGDIGSADWRHFGRLAGFTNRKEKHRQANGHFPYVRLIEATGEPYPLACTVVSEVKNALTKETEQTLRNRALFQQQAGQTKNTEKSIADFRNDPKYGGAHSRGDLAFAVYSLDHGVPESHVREHIASQGLSYVGSPARQLDYIERIVQKALKFLHSPARER